MKSVICQTIVACVHETCKQKKMADEEEESRRQLQLADGGLDVETGSKKSCGKTAWRRNGQDLDVSMSPPNGRIMSLLHLPLNHNQPIGAPLQSAAVPLGTPICTRHGIKDVIKCSDVKEIWGGGTHSLGLVWTRHAILFGAVVV